MSRDRVTMTRAEAIRLRHEEEQKRRESLVKKTIARPKPAAAKPKINQRPLRLVPAKSQGGARGKPAPAKAAKPASKRSRRANRGMWSTNGTEYAATPIQSARNV